MSDEPRYNANLTYFEHLIAGRDEIDIEEELWCAPQNEDDSLLPYREAQRAALREIERLKLAGTYEAERARLAAYLEPISDRWSIVGERYAGGELKPLENFLNGMKSADPDQKARFQDLYDRAGLADKTPPEFWHILECLEAAKKPRGRPNATPPWRNVAVMLDRMRIQVFKGKSVPEAARDASLQEGRAQVENRAKYFERLYRDRMKLRK